MHLYVSYVHIDMYNIYRFCERGYSCLLGISPHEGVRICDRLKGQYKKYSLIRIYVSIFLYIFTHLLHIFTFSVISMYISFTYVCVYITCLHI